MIALPGAIVLAVVVAVPVVVLAVGANVEVAFVVADVFLVDDINSSDVVFVVVVVEARVVDDTPRVVETSVAAVDASTVVMVLPVSGAENRSYNLC